jgi:transposase
LGALYISNWPPSSPDLSAAEWPWSQLKPAVSMRAPYGYHQLAKFVAEEFDKLSQETIAKVCAKSVEKIKQCKRLHGETTS